MVRDINTAERIMDVAQEMVQTRGYHAFSYRDISERIGIKTASIHYYYPSKPDLAKALLERIRGMFEEALDAIDAEGGDAKTRLRKFTKIFLDTYGDDGRLCPFCMIATSQETIPEAVQDEVRLFWLKGEQWVRNILDEGINSGEIEIKDSDQLMSRMMVSSLEGAMVVAKAFDDRARLEATADFMLSLVDIKK